MTTETYSVDDLETIYSLDDLFADEDELADDEELDYPVSREEDEMDEMIYEMLGYSVDDLFAD